MTQQVDPEPTIEQLLEQLGKEGNIHSSEFVQNLKRLINKLCSAWDRLMSIIQVVERYKPADSQLAKEIERIKQDLYPEQVSILAERLRQAGWRFGETLSKSLSSESEDWTKSIRGHLFRLMELTRLGKRSEVFHALLRLYYVNEEKIPKDLVNAFRPFYSDESFKVLIFSFLSGIEEKMYEQKQKAGSAQQ